MRPAGGEGEALRREPNLTSAMQPEVHLRPSRTITIIVPERLLSSPEDGSHRLLGAWSPLGLAGGTAYVLRKLPVFVGWSGHPVSVPGVLHVSRR